MEFNEDDLNTGSYLGSGEHEVTIIKADVGQSRSGKPMMTVEFKATNGKTCMDWFVLEYRKKIASLALAAGASKETLKSGQWTTDMLTGKKLKLVREVTGKRTYSDRDGVIKETDNFENSYLPIETNASFTDEQLPF
jgi:hypothetical protein